MASGRCEQSQAGLHRRAGVKGQLCAREINASRMLRGTTASLLIGSEWGILSTENLKVKGRSPEKAMEKAAVQRSGRAYNSLAPSGCSTADG